MGCDKATLRAGPESLLERVVGTLSEVVDEVIVVGPRREQARIQNGRFIDDLVPHAGPLGGIATGLSQMQGDVAAVVACDLPFLNGKLVTYLLSLATGYDAVVPRVDGRAQPTHAVYARGAIGAALRHMHGGRLSLTDLLEALDVRWVEDDEVRSIDPLALSFVNVNTPEDWTRWGHIAASTDSP